MIYMQTKKIACLMIQLIIQNQTEFKIMQMLYFFLDNKKKMINKLKKNIYKIFKIYTIINSRIIQMIS